MGIEIKLLHEAGYEQALLGLSKNKKQGIEGMAKVASKLAPLDNGHNKFLESMQVWLEINAPRYWWQEFDTYRIGTTKQSESTMHTLTKDDLDLYVAFEEGTNPNQISYVMDLITAYNSDSYGGNKPELFLKIKANLPEGFMQCRVVNLNYKTLRHIYKQRKNHRLIHWKVFCAYMLNHLLHSGFIVSSKQGE